MGKNQHRAVRAATAALLLFVGIGAFGATPASADHADGSQELPPHTSGPEFRCSVAVGPWTDPQRPAFLGGPTQDGDYTLAMGCQTAFAAGSPPSQVKWRLEGAGVGPTQYGPESWGAVNQTSSENGTQWFQGIWFVTGLTQAGADQPVNWHCQSVNNKACTTIHQYSAGPASRPADYWPGGSAGPIAEEPDGTCRITRYSTASDGSVLVTTVATVTPQTGTTDVIEVDWGDGSAPETVDSGAEVTHDYGVPTSGETWSAVWTATRTSDSDPSDTAENECEVTVDPGNTPLNEGRFGGPPDGEGPEDEDGDESCAVWDVPCWLRRLFIPRGDELAASFDSLYDTASTGWPLGPGIWVMGSAADFVSAIEGCYNGGECGADGNAEGTGLTVVNGSPCRWEIPIPVAGTEDSVSLPLGDTCDGSPFAGAATWIRRLSTVLLVVGFVWFVVGRVQSATGGSET